MIIAGRGGREGGGSRRPREGGRDDRRGEGGGQGGKEGGPECSLDRLESLVVECACRGLIDSGLIDCSLDRLESLVVWVCGRVESTGPPRLKHCCLFAECVLCLLVTVQVLVMDALDEADAQDAEFFKALSNPMLTLLRDQVAGRLTKALLPGAVRVVVTSRCAPTTLDCA